MSNLFQSHNKTRLHEGTHQACCNLSRTIKTKNKKKGQLIEEKAYLKYDPKRMSTFV